MAFVLREQTKNRYFHKNGKIILFETEQEAQNFLNNFAQFALVNAFGTGTNIMEVQQVCQSAIIEPPPKVCSCGFIDFKDI